MADFADFFYSKGRHSCGKRVGTTTALVSGPPRCGKTSLLFQFAYNMALGSSSRVIFICKRQRLENKPPLIHQEIDPSSEVFSRISLKYVNDDNDIRRYFAAFHMQTMAPSAVVIDDFSEYFDEGKCRVLYGHVRAREIAMVNVLSLAVDATNHASCQLLISETRSNQGPYFMYIYQKWISKAYLIKVLDGATFSLTVDGDKSGDQKILYSITPHSIQPQNLRQ